MAKSTVYDYISSFKNTGTFDDKNRSERSKCATKQEIRHKNQSGCSLRIAPN